MAKRPKLVPAAGQSKSDDPDSSNNAPMQTPAQEEQSDQTTEHLYPGSPDSDNTEEDEIIEHEDGSATVLPKTNKTKDIGSGRSEHFANLAETMGESELKAICMDLVELIEKDKTAQEDRDKLYARGLKMTGITEDAPGGADFPGASRATHPLIAECAVDAAASLYKELFPADGPCKIKLVGDTYDDKLLDRSERVKSFMNYQLTDEIAEYEEELDQTISQVPLAGSQFMKWWYDEDLDRPATEYVPQDKMYLPYSEQGFLSARRKTHHFNLPQIEYDRRVENKLYKDVPYSEPSNNTDQSATQKQIDRIQGETMDGSGPDSDLEMYESYVYWDAEGDGIAPYIITIRVQDMQCVGIRRNWEESDDRRREMDWLVEYPYIRWRGSLTLGFVQLIGGLSVAATGALRALLDSAFVNNTPSALKLKGARFGGQTQQVNPVGIAELEASPGTRDIRQLVMPFPFNPPSPTLFQLLGFLVEAAQGVVTTAEEKIADASNSMPMGTALALIEQGGKVFSAIHKRMHKAQKKSLKILYRLNRMYLTEKRVIEELGELTVSPEDFAGPCPIIPVSDPNIFSDAQRFAQLQAVIQLSQMFPGKYNVDKINKRALQLLKIPDPDDLLTPEPEPQDLNPVAENMAMGLGKPATAFPMQDHLAHIQSHITFYKDPSFGQNPLIGPTFIGPFVEHMKQHIIMLYAKMCYDAASAAAGQPVDQLITQDTENRNEFDKLMAIVGMHVSQQSAQVLKDVLPLVAQAAQQAQQQKGPAPMDPTAVAAQQVQVEAAKNQADNQTNVIDLQQKKQKMEQDAALQQQQMQVDAADAQRRDQTLMAKEQAAEAAANQRQQTQSEFDAQVAANAERTKQAAIVAANERNAEDNQTAVEIAASRALEGKVGNETSGKGLTNPKP